MYIMPIMDSFEYMQKNYKFDQIWTNMMFNLIPDKPYQGKKKWPFCTTMDDEAYAKLVKAINFPAITNAPFFKKSLDIPATWAVKCVYKDKDLSKPCEEITDLEEAKTSNLCFPISACAADQVEV